MYNWLIAPASTQRTDPPPPPSSCSVYQNHPEENIYPSTTCWIQSRIYYLTWLHAVHWVRREYSVRSEYKRIWSEYLLALKRIKQILKRKLKRMPLLMAPSSESAPPPPPPQSRKEIRVFPYLSYPRKDWIQCWNFRTIYWAKWIPWNTSGIPSVLCRPIIVQKYLPLSGKYACVVMLRNTDSGQIYIPSIQPISNPRSWRTFSLKTHFSSATSETIYAAALHLGFYLSM